LIRRIKADEDVIGPDNDRHIAEQTDGRDVVCAWGSIPVPGIRERANHVLSLCGKARSLLCFGKSKTEQPLHPLTLPFSTELRQLR